MFRLPPWLPILATQRAGRGADPDPLHEDQDFKLPKGASLVIMIVYNILLQLSFFIIVSSSNKYAEYLGGNSTFSGVVIGIPTVFAGLALIPMTRHDEGRYTMPIHIGCFAAILGHVAYAIAYRANFLYLILVGRCLSGVSFSGFMYIKRYCTDPRIVGVRRRTTLASWLVIGQGIGMSLGPFLGGLLYKIGFRSSIFNGYTSPGWIMACVYVIFWIIVAKFFEDVPHADSGIELRPAHRSLLSPLGEEKRTGRPPILFPSAETTGPPSSQGESLRSQLSQVTLPQWGVIFCMCWFSMLCFFVLGAWEANLPVFGAATSDLNWSPFAAGNFIALGGITAFPFLLINMLFARRIQDRQLLAIGSALGVSGLSIFLLLLRSRKVAFGSLFACWWTIALGFNLATTVTLSLLSKQLPPEWNGRISMAIQYSNYTGRVTGAIWGGSGVAVGMLNYVGLEIALGGIGAVLFTTLWKNLKTKTG
ncbi:major facilitator superfamily domain-containing protein [Phlebopus sp. FC_14]|nr:major facilitator superfamily domain-containing protein [Phlebopus sp. FC_14]